MLHDVVENTPLLSIRLASVAPAHRVGVSRVLRRQLAQLMDRGPASDPRCQMTRGRRLAPPSSQLTNDWFRAPYAFSRRPLSPAFRPFIGPVKASVAYKLYQRPRWLTHAGDSRIAAGLIQVGAGDSRHAISGQIARGLYGGGASGARPSVEGRQPEPA